MPGSRGLCTLLMRPARVLRSAIVLRPSTLLHFHKMLTKQKYRVLFSPKRVRRPGPKGPTKELIDAVVEMKRRNRHWGCKRIAQPYVPLSHPFVEQLIGRSGGSTWTKHYSGQRTWTASSEPSSIISIDIVRTRAWKDGCQSLVKARLR